MPTKPSCNTIADLIIADLVDASGGDTERWREIVGPVHAFQYSGTSKINWAVVPGGMPRERAAIGRSIAKVQARHPIVRC